MHRRQFLAAGSALLAAGLAGCAHPPVVLDFEAATADDIAGEVSLHPEPGSEEYRVVTSARENGSATRRGRYDLFDRTDTVRVGDAFYEVTETRRGSSEVTVYEVGLDLNPENATPTLGEIAYEGLPATDRQRLAQIVQEGSPPTQDGVDVGVGYGTAEEVGNDSVLVPDQQYDVLVYGDERYRVAVDSRTAEQVEYRYEVTEVAPDVQTFADRVRARYRFELAGLSEAERAVVAEAIDGAYFEETDAFRSVVDRLRDHEAIRVADFYGTWLLEYEGDEYIAYAEW